jgi:P27 family predicted phage terminase small subunit
MSRRISVDDAKLRGYSNDAIARGAVASGKSEEHALEGGRPDAPAHLSESEKSVWDATVALLEHRGTLTPGDGPTLMLYCQTFCELRAERALLEREGRVQTVSRLDKNSHEILIRAVNPRVRVVRDLEKQLTILLRELGLTPLRRHGVREARNKNPLSEGQKVLREAQLLMGRTN